MIRGDDHHDLIFNFSQLHVEFESSWSLIFGLSGLSEKERTHHESHHSHHRFFLRSKL